MTAPATLGAAEQSILSPVLIALRSTHDPAQLLAVAWHAAIQSFPVTAPQLNLLVKEGRRTVAKAFPHIRSLAIGESERHPQIVRLCDSYKGQSSDERWDRWRWSVGAAVITTKQQPNLQSDAAAHIRLDVVKFRVTGGIVDNAAELALFRHYVITGLQAIDPRAQVTGGQHDWNPRWWQVPAI